VSPKSGVQVDHHDCTACAARNLGANVIAEYFPQIVESLLVGVAHAFEARDLQQVRRSWRELDLDNHAGVEASEASAATSIAGSPT
jgi:hypothetical protein